MPGVYQSSNPEHARIQQAQGADPGMGDIYGGAVGHWGDPIWCGPNAAREVAWHSDEEHKTVETIYRYPTEAHWAAHPEHRDRAHIWNERRVAPLSEGLDTVPEDAKLHEPPEGRDLRRAFQNGGNSSHTLSKTCVLG